MDCIENLYWYVFACKRCRFIVKANNLLMPRHGSHHPCIMRVPHCWSVHGLFNISVQFHIKIVIEILLLLNLSAACGSPVPGTPPSICCLLAGPYLLTAVFKALVRPATPNLPGTYHDEASGTVFRVFGPQEWFTPCAWDDWGCMVGSDSMKQLAAAGPETKSI